MITIHNLVYTRAHRIAWLLEELGIEYQIKNYHRDQATYAAPPDFLAVHPVGQSPTITDGDLTLGESGAIIEYILYKYGNGKLKPTEGSKDWIEYLYWFHLSEGSMMNMLLVMRLLNKFHGVVTNPNFSFVEKLKHKIPAFCLNAVRSQIHAIVVGPRLGKAFDFAEERLKQSKWFGGEEFSAADIQMAVPLIYARNMKELTKPRPKIDEFIKRAQERPAFIRATEKAGTQDKGWID